MSESHFPAPAEPRVMDLDLEEARRCAAELVPSVKQCLSRPPAERPAKHPCTRCVDGRIYTEAGPFWCPDCAPPAERERAP